MLRNIIRYNLVRDVVGCGAYGRPTQPTAGTAARGKIWTPYYGWGIYLDWNPVRTTVYGNIVVGNTLGGIMMLGDAKDNVIENNIFVDGSQSQICYLSMSDKARGNRFVRNIVAYTDPGALLIRIGRRPDRRSLAESDCNLFFPPPGRDPRIDLPEAAPEDSFAKWRQIGYETRSIIGDPQFVDTVNGDYRLKPDSPAYELGFQAIDVDRIGPGSLAE